MEAVKFFIDNIVLNLNWDFPILNLELLNLTEPSSLKPSWGLYSKLHWKVDLTPLLHNSFTIKATASSVAMSSLVE